ncbi:MAG: hypothetical protein K8R63_13530 [Bacteroidales bacterium]|nr:hypothetical protein [Bacteroidales bacterium]
MANDNFETYFAEKLWEMIPAIYRHEDGLDTNPNKDVLRSFVLLFAEQAAILRRSHDRLWDDQFIDLCCEWAVPYIADLVGTRLLSDLNKRGRRIDVAKTIYYRRRKGTLRVLEELISDITGWEGVAVEKFKRLGRSRHGLDPFPAVLSGMHTKTLPGGWADIRQQQGSELTISPFDEFYYTADVRQQKGTDGLFGIPKLAFYLYRLTSFRVEDVDPFDYGDGLKYGFDPSGRDIPLFAQRDRPDDWDEWRSAYEWELPLPIRCRLLGHAEYMITESIIQKLVDDHELYDEHAANDLRTISNVLFYNYSRLKFTLQTLFKYDEIKETEILLPLLGYALTDQCGKKALLPDYSQDAGLVNNDSYAIAVKNITSSELFSTDKTSSGNLNTWANNAPEEKMLIIDPENGRLLFKDDMSSSEISVTYHYGFSGNIGAGAYEREQSLEQDPDTSLSGGKDIPSDDWEDDCVAQIEDNKTYWPDKDHVIISNLTLQAANSKRPYIRLDAPWILEGGTADATLCLNGLWLGSTGEQELILRGDFECVVIKHCTLDPGGDTDLLGNVIYPLPLVIEGHIETLVIDSSITAPIYCRNGGLVENIKIYDAIIQSIEEGLLALKAINGTVEIERATMFGGIEALRLNASETIFTKTSTVADTQNGCFRFSAAPEDSRLPKPYESYLFSGDTNYWFTSKRFGQPGYAQITEVAPIEIMRGAETGSEMGAFSSLINPIKMDNLQTKVEEYMPFGLIPLFIHET